MKKKKQERNPYSCIISCTKLSEKEQLSEKSCICCAFVNMEKGRWTPSGRVFSILLPKRLIGYTVIKKGAVSAILLFC